MNCASCLKTIEGKRFLKCQICTKKYDLSCANVTDYRFNSTMTAHQKLAWKCAQCLKKEPRLGGTPVHSIKDGVTRKRGAAARSPLNTSIEESLDLSSLSIVHNDESRKEDVSDIQLLIKEVRQFREEMSATRSQIEIFNMNISKLNDRMNSCDSRIDQLNKRYDVLEQRLENSITVEPVDRALYDTVQQLKSELNDRDQELLMNDVEISCIPESRGENLTHVVMTLASKVGMTLCEQDIVSVARVGRFLHPRDVPEPSQPPRPRAIVARLARRVVRDKLLQSARVRRGATTEDANLPGPSSRFYINERLTKVNRSLFRRAREIGQRLHWRFIWTKDGKIYARQHGDGNSPRLRLRSEQDLTRVFGHENIGS